MGTENPFSPRTNPALSKARWHWEGEGIGGEGGGVVVAPYSILEMDSGQLRAVRTVSITLAPGCRLPA